MSKAFQLDASDARSVSRALSPRFTRRCKPPTRLALGSDTVAGIEKKHHDVKRELDLWRPVSLSTDFRSVTFQ